MNCKILKFFSGAATMKSLTGILTITLITACLIADPAYGAKKKRVVVKPKHAGHKVEVSVSGKVRTYYPLSSSRASLVELTGPGELEVVTRAGLDTNSSDDVSYTLLYKIDGGEQRSFTAEGIERSPDARYVEAGSVVPGEVEKLVLPIGRGNHSMEILLRDSHPMVCARYLLSHRKQKGSKWITMTPLAPLEPVDLHEGETTLHYNRFSNEKPLKIEIIGPTELRILTRVENSFNMKGLASYRLQIRQDGVVLQSYQLTSRRSETAVYKNNPKLVPGKAREVIFIVPKGRQHYEIVPLDDHTLLGQVHFPQKDVKLGL